MSSKYQASDRCTRYNNNDDMFNSTSPLSLLNKEHRIGNLSQTSISTTDTVSSNDEQHTTSSSYSCNSHNTNNDQKHYKPYKTNVNKQRQQYNKRKQQSKYNSGSSGADNHNNWRNNNSSSNLNYTVNNNYSKDEHIDSISKRINNTTLSEHDTQARWKDNDTLADVTNKHKTELCRNFNKYGNCKLGSRCRFAHGSDELRSGDRSQEYKSLPCYQCTLHNQHCPYDNEHGLRCNYTHVGEPLRNVKGAVCYREEQFQQALKQQSHDIAEPFGLYM